MIFFSERIFRSLLVVLALVYATIAGAADSDLHNAQRMLNQGKPGQALAILSLSEPEMAGDSRFDYLFGLALLETGQTGKAIFALQRAVDNDPEFAAARLDLARAYFLEENMADARFHLLILRDQNPPPAAQREIRNLLAQIDSKTEPGKNNYQAYARFATGYDSNANAATDASRFLGFVLDPESRETDSPYAAYALGGEIQRPFEKGLIWNTRADLGQRNYPDASFVNATLGSIRSRLRKVAETTQYSAGVLAYRLNTDDKLNSKGISLEGDYEHQLNRRTYIGFLGKWTAIRYADNQDVRDVDQFLFGSSISRVFGETGMGNVVATLLLGRDNARLSDSKYNRDIAGLQVFVGWNFNSRVSLQTFASVSRSNYDDVFFPQQVNEDRKDTLSQITLRLTWKINRSWFFDYSYSHQMNNSNVEVFEYDRDVAGVSLRRIFR
ncbi:MAG: tetratricopeptide repeat protein [Gammaproteobacteria bacterium]|nr:tetratricopeptide repeat protein [Gammaproteobacteria bacterium]